ncbi:arginine N-methyltransferase-like protein [Leptomonas pyrrhocoris]|uniref:type I protein arginine methyltransferase n=1 Tax=Leptomonas pyrrhocoris TaxID=157538 RepID=A0A0M9FTF1_LEPPY|nr:arginine N-methyltransferase-like protein [Leptomonas pyrrhocoris]KPA75663.1 arginine N-methyltransferase-like protein [Leptomonas pyrrhocoris]|eukprot:XP_015654102.1 arginine N-methyltransferase-like protein [Leptomonas pyrrhocoris]
MRRGHFLCRHFHTSLLRPTQIKPRSSFVMSATDKTASAAEAEAAAAVAAVEKTHASKDYYFDSYSHYGIHMEMLKDYHRTTSYRDAMWRNGYMFKDKVVLDVGCGTGILSMFAARAGARKVIGIDCSSVAVQARQIVQDNGFGDVITIIQGKVEELELDEKVDIIISEWMGYFLLYESMLNTVLYARDRWGTPEVKILPDHANMYACGIADPQYVEQKFDIWKNVSGLDYSYFRRLSYIEPLIDTVQPEQITTDIVPFFSFDINKVKEEELSFTSTFTLEAQQADMVHAISVHFDTPFNAGHDPVVLNTSPLVPPTHWRQTVLYLFHPMIMKRGEKANFTMKCAPNPGNPRDLDIALRIDFDGELQACHYDQDFRLR